LLALQTSDEHKVAMPLDWQPGDKVIVPAPKTVEALAERKSSDLEMVDWYLAKKSI
jgi:peroxiredoxin (alkyl hydroperoxide reductase subunit C)